MLQQDTTAGEMDAVKNIWLKGCAGSKLISFLLVCPFADYFILSSIPLFSLSFALKVYTCISYSWYHEENNSKERNYCSNQKPLEHRPYTQGVQQMSLKLHSEISHCLI